MGLSPLELVEDDCGTNIGIEIHPFDVKFAETLVGKYYKDPHNPTMDWKVLDFETSKSFINKKLIIRSPITCQTPHFKMCKKCFGVREFPTTFVGVTAAQCLAERLTQLILRTFHTSGGAELQTSDSAKTFFAEYLTDIITTDDNIVVELNQNFIEIPDSIKLIEGYREFKDNKIIFDPIRREVHNKDYLQPRRNGDSKAR